MGVSSDGILVFGIALDGEDQLPAFLTDNDFDDIDDYLDSISGLPQIGEPGHSYKELEEYRDSCVADLTLYCSYDYPMYILSLRGTEVTSYCGALKEIDSASMMISQKKIDALKEWAAKRGIEGEPKWYLCSIYG